MGASASPPIPVYVVIMDGCRLVTRGSIVVVYRFFGPAA
jgi:hypothetical protein